VANASRVALEFEAPEIQCSEEGIAKIDVFAFALILFEIVVNLPVLGKTDASEGLGKMPVNMCERIEIPGFVPEFVSVLILSGLSTHSREGSSLDDVSEALKKNSFRIADGVDSDAASALVSLVESSET
jgi:hypothetical protein